ncbi:hypothetical protein [Flavobacterium sp. PL12]|uniref:hypothetical protein n=1 Tax=Flavobacterium sp. PL12 TaxID=3071718 RepID=UPI00319EA1AD
MKDKINVINDNLNDIIALIIEERLKQAVEELAAIVPVQKEFYSIDEASHILSISVYGLKSREKSKKIKLIRDQNNIIVHYKELDRYKKLLLK